MQSILKQTVCRVLGAEPSTAIFISVIEIQRKHRAITCDTYSIGLTACDSGSPACHSVRYWVMASRALLPKLHYTNNSRHVPKKLKDLEGFYFFFF